MAPVFLALAITMLSATGVMAQSMSFPGRGGINGGASATLQATPGAPASTGSTTGVMMGVGNSCKLTPLYSTRVKLEFVGSVSNNTATGIPVVGIRYGTGAAPANAAALTGTSIGTAPRGTIDTANGLVPIGNSVIITGLVAGTAYWFDLTLAVNGGTGSLSDVSCNAFEF